MFSLNLADRLQRPTRIGYGNRYTFCYRGEEFWDKSRLIFFVAERYSSRFGAINNEQANELYHRLAYKYCVERGWYLCFRSIEHTKLKDAFGRPIIAHPEAFKQKLFILKFAREQVDQATKNTVYSYCKVNSGESRCLLCGKYNQYTLFKNGKEILCYQSSRKPFEDWGYGVCRRPICKAIKNVLLPKISKRSYFPMISVLAELTKHGDRSESVSSIKSAFVAIRDVQQAHNKRN